MTVWSSSTSQADEQEDHTEAQRPAIHVLLGRQVGINWVRPMQRRPPSFSGSEDPWTGPQAATPKPTQRGLGGGVEVHTSLLAPATAGSLRDAGGHKAPSEQQPGTPSRLCPATAAPGRGGTEAPWLSLARRLLRSQQQQQRPPSSSGQRGSGQWHPPGTWKRQHHRWGQGKPRARERRPVSLPAPGLGAALAGCPPNAQPEPPCPGRGGCGDAAAF